MFATNRSDFNWKFIYVILYIYVITYIIYDYKIIYEIPLQSIEPVELVNGLATAFALLAALPGPKRPTAPRLHFGNLCHPATSTSPKWSKLWCYHVLPRPLRIKSMLTTQIVVVPCGTFSPFFGFTLRVQVALAAALAQRRMSWLCHGKPSAISAAVFLQL